MIKSDRKNVKQMNVWHIANKKTSEERLKDSDLLQSSVSLSTWNWIQNRTRSNRDSAQTKFTCVRVEPENFDKSVKTGATGL